jgi:ABC-type amino acid transport substrate-binding protein
MTQHSPLRRRVRRASMAAAAIGSALTLAACGGSDDDSSSTAAAGSASGSPDLGLKLNALAKDLGVKLKIENLDFNGLIPGLQAKKFDIVSVGLSPTPERKNAIDFSRAYVPYALVVAVPEGDTTPGTVDAFNQSSKKFTALQGSTGETLAKKTFPKATVTGFSEQNAALLQVATKRANASVLEDYILARYQKSNPGQIKKADFPKPLDVQYGSYGVVKGNSGLVKRLDTFLCKAQTDGTLAKIYKKNFSVDEFPTMPAGC